MINAFKSGKDISQLLNKNAYNNGKSVYMYVGYQGKAIKDSLTGLFL